MVAEEDNHGLVVNAFFLQSSDMMTHPIVQPFEVAIILVDVLSDLRMFRKQFRNRYIKKVGLAWSLHRIPNS